MNSLLKGLNRVDVNREKIGSDLDNNWLLRRGNQTILAGRISKPYEALLNLPTNEKITRESIAGFIDSLDISEPLKSELKGITPFNYTGF